MKKYSTKKKLKKQGLVTAIVSVMLVMSATVSGTIWNDAKTNAEKELPIVKEFLMTTNLNKPVRAKLDSNPIGIIINGLSDKDKQTVIEAIERLDNISDNISYTILDKDDINITQKIYINNNSSLYEQKNVLGEAQITYNEYTGYIQYPVQVNIDVVDCYNYISETTGNNILATVVKHEMMHTLGFKDLYNTDNNQISNSIMGDILKYNLEDYTALDEFNIKSLYDNYVTTYTPSSALLCEVGNDYIFDKKSSDELEK